MLPHTSLPVSCPLPAQALHRGHSQDGMGMVGSLSWPQDMALQLT